MYYARNDGSTFQSMLRLATFQIDRAAYDDGFFIVFLVTADDSLCGSKDPPKLNRKDAFEETINILNHFVFFYQNLDCEKYLIAFLFKISKSLPNRMKTFKFSITEDISKNILGLYYALRVALITVVALCVLALHIYCNTFNDKRLDEMIEEEVKEIKVKEEIRANIQNVAVAVLACGDESQVKCPNSC